LSCPHLNVSWSPLHDCHRCNDCGSWLDRDGETGRWRRYERGKWILEPETADKGGGREADKIIINDKTDTTVEKDEKEVAGAAEETQDNANVQDEAKAEETEEVKEEKEVDETEKEVEEPGEEKKEDEQ
jgi:hypothetical protein